MTSDKASALIRDMDEHFGLGEGNRSQSGEGGISRDGTAEAESKGQPQYAPAGPIGLSVSGGNPDAQPDAAKSFKLHEYKREPKKRVIAEGKFKEQDGLCAWSKSEGAVCDGSYFELDHIDGDPDDWTWENMELLCEHHHRVKTNADRAKSRHSTSLCVKKPGVSFEGAGLSPRSVSMENDKHENYDARFRVAAPAYFASLEWDNGESPKVVLRIFRRAMIGACTYTDEAGREHTPSQVTMDRFIDARIYPDNPSGWFTYAQLEGQDALSWAGKRPEGARVVKSRDKPSMDVPQAHIVGAPE